MTQEDNTKVEETEVTTKGSSDFSLFHLQVVDKVENKLEGNGGNPPERFVRYGQGGVLF